MKNNIKTFKQAFKNFKIINTKELLKNQEKNCKKTNTNPEVYDFLFCNVIAPTSSLNPFINQVYNEILRYSLFTSYYQNQLSLSLNTNVANTLQLSSELELLSTYPSQIISSTNDTLQQLSELQNNYPLHIGMLIYQEDLLDLRNNYLSKLVNPFYSLYYKLQNVQIKK